MAVISSRGLDQQKENRAKVVPLSDRIQKAYECTHSPYARTARKLEYIPQRLALRF